MIQIGGVCTTIEMGGVSRYFLRYFSKISGSGGRLDSPEECGNMSQCVLLKCRDFLGGCPLPPVPFLLEDRIWTPTPNSGFP